MRRYIRSWTKWCFVVLENLEHLALISSVESKPGAASKILNKIQGITNKFFPCSDKRSRSFEIPPQWFHTIIASRVMGRSSHEFNLSFNHKKLVYHIKFKSYLCNICHYYINITLSLFLYGMFSSLPFLAQSPIWEI